MAAADALDVARLLLERGASIDIVDNNKQTALDIAKQRGHKRMQSLFEKMMTIKNNNNDDDNDNAS